MAPSLRFAVTAWALTATACLSTPGPASGGDDDDTDAPAVSCRQDARPAGTPWPPSDIAVRHALVADIDRDGTGDLVVSVAPRPPLTATASRVYVLYGPLSPTAPEWHAMLDLDDDAIDAEVQPLAVSLDDLDGDGCLDLTVAGAPTAGNQQDRAAVWRHTGRAIPWSGAPATAALDFDVTADGPVMAVWGDFGVGGGRDLAVADLYNVRMLTDSTVTLLGNSTEVPYDPCPSWDNVNALVTAPGATRDRLLVFGHYRSNAVELDDVGAFHVTGSCANGDVPQLRGYGVAALDAIAPLDLLTGAAGTIGARVLSGSAPIEVPAMGVQACPPTARGGQIEGITAGNLGGTATPDVAIIDYDPGETPTPGTYACLVSELSVDGDQVRKQFDDEVRVADGELRLVLIGDLGSGARVWMLADDGRLHCRRRAGSNAVLVPC